MPLKQRDPMPKTCKIPARTEHRCSPCQYHKLTGAFHTRCGEGSWRSYSCMHPEAYNDQGEEAFTPELQARMKAIDALICCGGRYIGRTELQPDWCPLKRESGKP